MASNGLSRRTLLRTAFAAGIMVAAGSRAQESSARILQRPISVSGEMLPVVGLGTSDAFEVAPGQSRADQRQVLAGFFDLGGRLIDTSPTYGDAESVVGDLLRESDGAQRAFIATKVHETGRAAGIAQMEASETRLGRKPLDLIQVHNLVDVKTQLQTLYDWKVQGRVRYVGITHYLTSAFDALAVLMETEHLDFVQFNYSIMTPDAERRLLPLARDRGISVIINRAFEDGAFFHQVRGQSLPPWASEFDCQSWAQFALKYVLSEATVTCVIPATSNPRHLVDNMQAGFGIMPDAAMRRRMRDYLRRL